MASCGIVGHTSHPPLERARQARKMRPFSMSTNPESDKARPVVVRIMSLYLPSDRHHHHLLRMLCMPDGARNGQKRGRMGEGVWRGAPVPQPGAMCARSATKRHRPGLRSPRCGGGPFRAVLGRSGLVMGGYPPSGLNRPNMYAPFTFFPKGSESFLDKNYF